MPHGQRFSRTTSKRFGGPYGGPHSRRREKAMQLVTRQFLAQTYTSGRVVSSADIYLGTTLLLEDAPVTEASVTMDIDSDIIRSANITLVDLDNSGSGHAEGDNILMGNLDVFRVEIVLKCGFVLPNGDTEVVPLGRYMIWEASRQYHEGEALAIEMYDLTKYLDMYDLVKPYDASNVFAKAAIQKLVDDSMPYASSVTFDSLLGNPLLPPGTVYDANALDAVAAIADIMGGQFYFNAEGQPVVARQAHLSPEDPITRARFVAACGPTGNITSISASVSRDTVYNAVAVYGAAAENLPQPYGEVFDLHPGSRTFWGGPFGKKILKLQRPELLTAGECYAAANAKLRELSSGARPLTLGILPNPALEPGDVIRVIFPDGVSEELHLIRQIDFDYSEMTMTLRTSGASTDFA